MPHLFAIDRSDHHILLFRFTENGLYQPAADEISRNTIKPLPTMLHV